MVLVAYDQAAEVRQPGDGSFNLPTSAVTPELASILGCLSTATFAMRTDQIPTLSQQSFPQGVAIVGPIGDQRRGLFFLPRDLVDDSFDQRDLSRRSRRGNACEWNSLAIRHHQPLCTLSAFGFSDAGAPFFAGENVPSTKTSSQSISPCSFSVSRKACQMRTSTSSVSHSTSRRQHVLGEGKRSGKSRQRAPLRSTHKMPSKHARSAARGRPPLALLHGCGMNGLIRSHCSSVSKTSCRLRHRNVSFQRP